MLLKSRTGLTCIRKCPVAVVVPNCPTVPAKSDSALTVSVKSAAGRERRSARQFLTVTRVPELKAFPPELKASDNKPLFSTRPNKIRIGLLRIAGPLRQHYR